MPAVNLGLLTTQAQRNPYVVQVDIPAQYLEGLTPGFRQGLEAMQEAMPPDLREELGAISGYRSVDHQRRLWESALERYGSPEAARQWVAPPGNSNHNHGNAVDLSYASDAAREWVHENAGQFGLHFPMSWENWHIEPMAEDGGRVRPSGGSVASAGQRPAQGLLGQGTTGMSRGGQQQEQQPFGQRLRDNFRTGGSGWDTLALGLNGMTLRPDPGLQGLAGGRIADRREAEREERRLNQTAEWLRSIGRDDLATAVMAGGVAPGAAGGIALAPGPNADEPPAPQTVAWLRENGQENLAVMVEQGLIQPSQALQQAMASPDQPSAVQQYEYLLGQGVDPEQALELAFGGGGTTVNVGGQGEVGTIPQGYELFTDPETGARSLRAIPGGPEDRTESDAAAAAGQEQTGGLMLEDIGRAMTLVRESPNLTTGVLGGILANIPGSSAADLQALMDTIAANISFEALSQMRQASPTGGALGAISERELQLLQATSGSISTSQSPEQLVRNLERLATQIENVVNGPNAADAQPEQSAGSAPGGWSDLDPNVQSILLETHGEETLRRWYGDFQ